MQPALRAAAFAVVASWGALARAQTQPPSPPPPEPDAPPVATAPSAGFSLDEGAWAKAPDGLGYVRAGILVQSRFDLAISPDAAPPADEVRPSFLVRAVRPQLRGWLLDPMFRFFVQPELATPTPKLLDLELEIVPHEAIGLKVGQFLTPFSRTYYTPVPKLLFPEFAAANDFFRADRDTGAMLEGNPFGGVLEYELGVFDGNGIDKGGNDDGQVMVVGRFAVHPFGPVSYDETAGLQSEQPFRLAFGANAYHGEAVRSEAFVDPSTFLPGTRVLGTDENDTYGVDLAARWRGFTLQGELYQRFDRPPSLPDRAPRVESTGGYAHASAFVWPKRLELAGRVGWIDPDTAAPDDVLTTVEGQVAAYFAGNHLKTNLRYGWAHAGDAAATTPPQRLVTLQVQLAL